MRTKVTATWYGKWWLPGHEDLPLPGVLEQDAKGHFLLNLVGTFAASIEDVASVPLMHGVTNDQIVTLPNSFEMMRRPSTWP